MITADWLVRVEGNKRYLLTLNVIHSTERKRFSASFGQETEEQHARHTTRSFWIGGSAHIVTESVARYNARAAYNFYLGALATLRTLVAAGDERVAAVIAKAETQSTAP